MMDNLTEINEKLNSLYEQYKKNKSKLNGEKTKEAAKLLCELTFNKENAISDVAFQLSRFPADVVKIYFKTVTKGGGIPIELLDEVLRELLITDTNPNKSQFYVHKFVFAVEEIIKNYKEKAFLSSQLPKLVVFIARFAAKSNKYQKKFHDLMINTTGDIFKLDYSKIQRNSLVNIWNVTKNIFTDLTKTEYGTVIAEWAEKYGFIDETTNDNKTIPKSEEKAIDENKDNTAATDTKSAESEMSMETAKRLYNSLKKEMYKEQETIVAAVKELILPISKAIDSFQNEIGKSRMIGIENTDLKKRTEELESQLSGYKAMIRSLKSENNDIKKQITTLEGKNAELDAKLSDAYKINSRESSMGAERIRYELKESFKYLYEDWLEYEFSDVSEVNYESLQAIIKKAFRSLERNGIDFKGNNQ